MRQRARQAQRNALCCHDKLISFRLDVASYRMALLSRARGFLSLPSQMVAQAAHGAISVSSRKARPSSAGVVLAQCSEPILGLPAPLKGNNDVVQLYPKFLDILSKRFTSNRDKHKD